MKHKVSELEGDLLNAAVAKAEGWVLHDQEDWRAPPTPDDEQGALMASVGVWEPSTAWDHGGPIIEREHIGLTANVERLYCGLAPKMRQPWTAGIQWDYPDGRSVRVWQAGPTPLIAAMRAYVASKFGEEVELP